MIRSVSAALLHQIPYETKVNETGTSDASTEFPTDLASTTDFSLEEKSDTTTKSEKLAMTTDETTGELYEPPTTPEGQPPLENTTPDVVATTPEKQLLEGVTTTEVTDTEATEQLAQETTTAEGTDAPTTSEDQLLKESTISVEATVENATPSAGSEKTIVVMNTTVAATTTTTPKPCTDLINPKTGRSDCRRRKNLCTRAGFTDFMKKSCPVTCGYCKMCFDESARNGRGFCTQANIQRMCEHRNLRIRAATRNRCPVACGVCVAGTVLQLK
ncbi:hypothetical protein V3C99_013913 [Haemonchus contortus]|uniref:ShKT domain-containing protein n=1 Tax=Haemonchus contortus TaxID=6289 RepID=A0A7I4YSX5_HAECO